MLDALVSGLWSDDFTSADHLAMVEMPLTDIRARFGVPPLAV